MRIVFDRDKNHVVFLHENLEEYEKLAWFPGFAKISVYNTCPAVVPIAYSLVSRLSSFMKVKVDAQVQSWLDAEWKLKPLPESFHFHTSPKVYQEIALRYLYSVGSGGLLLDPGMGKSKVVLDYIYLMGFSKVIVVCPKALLFVWEDEIAVHRPELSFYTVKSTDWEKEKEGISSAAVTIINYSKAVTLSGFLKREGFQFMHIDEFLIKDHKTARTTSLTELSKHIPHRCGGSGTLINNSPMDMFAPVRYLQPALVGGSFSKFEKSYAVKSEGKNPRDPDKKIKFVVGYKNVAEARSILESCCIVMTKSQWLTLPEKKFKDSLVPMQGFQKEAYNTLRSNYIVEIPGHGYLEVDNPLVMMSKLYQIANGFLYLDSPPDELSALGLAPEESEGSTPTSKPKAKKVKDRKTFFFEENPKAIEFKAALAAMPTRRGIIWFNMGAELVIIEKVMSELGLKWEVIKGGEKDTGGKVRRFNKSTETQWMVCQAKSVNYGITVLGNKDEESLESIDPESYVPTLDSRVFTEVFYSVNFSLEVYIQQQDRIHRIGQENTCEYYRFFTTSAIERKLREALDEKMIIRQDMLIDIAHKLRSCTDESLV